MFKILKKSAIVSLIFAIILSFVVCAASITTQVSFEGSVATITGKIDGTSGQSEHLKYKMKMGIKSEKKYQNFEIEYRLAV